ncbi:M56 family metallopeptidase [Draconibacterium sp. IB214405]|uniref:M56 family metallopeptidase n=1 Tax=Draconibacterium sp. IB214405 TaxID=3097352 RepID=UPI002A16AFC1|nr:M56 family metallopeptidase [Draconibacterium sp. IB214405]MDX8337969.1 M56 family metallopeptidase [Draconibacterium sp. IB214405]
METSLFYLLNASGGIVLFYLVYWMFLRKETFHVANRWFLLGSLLLAILLPMVPVRYEVLLEASKEAKTGAHTIADTFKNIPVFNGTEDSTIAFGWQQAILLVYLTGAAIFLLRLLTQTAILIHLMIKYRVKSLQGMRVVENEKYGLPFSFFNVVFINPKFHTQDDLPEILAHEKVHIRENHWFDLLMIELLTVIFWFNPFIWMFERAIKQNHEYLADKGVLAQGHTVGRYQALLVNQLMGMQIIGITNNLNFALSTNRLKMMTKKKTSARRLIRFTWALPALALLLFAFAEPEYRMQELNEPEIADLQTSATKTLKISGLVVDENDEPLPGTSVVVKGGTTGCVSDMRGKFILEVPEKTAIVLSFVGKKTVVDDYMGILSGKDGEEYKRTYKMNDEIIGIGLATELLAVNNNDKIAPPPPPPPPPPSDAEVFYVVEDMPEYPGGSEALNNYAYKMQQKLAQAKGIKGKAKVLFTVNAKGKVTDIKVVEKENDGAAKGAYAIASQLEDWKPGKQRGKAVPVKYMLPVEFK